VLEIRLLALHHQHAFRLIFGQGAGYKQLHCRCLPFATEARAVAPVWAVRLGRQTRRWRR
jgi:hypothetical protein